MGGEVNRCSCLCKSKEDSNYAYLKTEQFDIPSVIDDNQSKALDEISQRKSFKYFCHNSNYPATLNEGNTYAPSEDIMIHSLNTSLLFKSNKPISIPSIVRIQSHYRGKAFRKEYKARLKKELQGESLGRVEELKAKFRVTAIDNKAKLTLALFNSNEGELTHDIDLKANEEKEGITFKHNCLELHGDNEGLYIGDVDTNNKPNGFGVLYTKDEEKIEGHWSNNVFSGQGRHLDKEGTVYSGMFSNKKLNGKGIRLTANGSKYIGDFVLGKREGKGKEETPELIYEGQYKGDKKNGKGGLRYLLLNDSYEGDFVDNCLTGQGRYQWANKDTFEGAFINGNMEGKGTYKFAEGGEYTGDYMNNIKEGTGKFTWPDGKVFEGQFHKGVPHGRGTLIVKDKAIEVSFKNGKIFSNIRELMLK